MKSAFPGSIEFSWENYSSLPCSYVLSAVSKAAELRHQALHEAERPVALLSSLYANSKRDPRKSKPSSYLDFSFYKPLISGEVPQSHYGSAYLLLLKQKRLPGWALFCYKAFADSAAADYVPAEPGLIAEDAILLHPEPLGRGYQGLLVAMESAGGQRKMFVNSKGDEIWLTVPEISSKVVAEESVILLP